MLAKVDLVDAYAVELNSNFECVMQLNNAPDLTLYTGYSQVRTSVNDTTISLNFTVQILNKNTFKVSANYNSYAGLAPGNYVYDVLFTKADHRFYAVGGKVQIVQRVTKL